MPTRAEFNRCASKGVTRLKTLAYIALNGSLGTGFKEESLERGLERSVSFIGADSGSTDGGPYYLGNRQLDLDRDRL